jgi:hypothetical protein
VAETNALLKRHTGNRIEGSNPSVSAKRRYFGGSGAFKSAEIPALPSKLPITSATWTHLFGGNTVRTFLHLYPTALGVACLGM